MPAADGRTLKRNYGRPAIRPARCCAPRRRLSRRFAMTEHAHAGCSSRRCSKRKMSEKLQLFLSRTKPAIRRHSRSYGEGCQCRYRQKEQNLVCIFYACCNAWPRPPGCPLKCGSSHSWPAYAAVRLSAVSHPAAAGRRRHIAA